jgi:hypothetical protein
VSERYSAGRRRHGIDLRAVDLELQCSVIGRSRCTAHREQTVRVMAELYLRARLAVERGYRGRLTLSGLARALAVSRATSSAATTRSG